MSRPSVFAGCDPRRGAAEVNEVASASVSSSGGGRGGGRDMVSLLTWNSSWLSQAIFRVDLRSPVVRRSIARVGDRSALASREHFNDRSEDNRVRNSRCFSLEWNLVGPLRRSPFLVENVLKTGEPELAILCLYNSCFVVRFVGVRTSRCFWLIEAIFERWCLKKGPSTTNSWSANHQYSWV